MDQSSFMIHLQVNLLVIARSIHHPIITIAGPNMQIVSTSIRHELRVSNGNMIACGIQFNVRTKPYKDTNFHS